MEQEYPLIIVIYLDRETISNEDIMPILAGQINDTIAQKNANMIAFFLPTDDNERIECINPIQVEETEMAKIYTIINDLTKNFDIGQGGDEGKNDNDDYDDYDDINIINVRDYD